MELGTILTVSAQVTENQQWFGYLLNLSLKSTGVLCLCALVSLAVRKYPAGVRHLVWYVGILALLLLPVFVMFIPPLEVTVGTAAVASPQAEEYQVLVTRISNSLSFWNRWIVSGYLLGSLLLLAYLGLSLMRIAFLKREAEPVRCSRLQQLAIQLQKQQSIEYTVSLRQSSRIHSPVSWGLFRPLIVLPADAGNWSDSKASHVLLHELGHIRRLDWLSHILGRIVCALYWYNPLVWYAMRRLQEEAEYCCDDEVLLEDRNHSGYARHLLEIARSANPGGARKILAEALVHSFLGRRIAGILDDQHARVPGDTLFLIRGLLVAFSLVMVVASIRLVPQVSVAAINQGLRNLISVNLDDSYPLSDGNADARPDFLPPSRDGINPVVPRLQLPSTEADVFRNMQSRSEILALKTPQIHLSTPQQRSTLRPLQAITEIFPVYPQQAIARGVEGFAVVQFDITEQGEVIHAMIIESSPGTVFDRSALTAIQGFRFQPQTLNGKAVGTHGLQTRFVYRLKPDPG